MDRILFFSIGISILIPLVQLFYLFYHRFFNKDSKFIPIFISDIKCFCLYKFEFCSYNVYKTNSF